MSFGLIFFLVVTGLAVVGVAAAFLWPSKHQTLVRKIARVPEARLTEAQPDEVRRFIGRARAGEPLLTSPFTGTPCLGYWVRIMDHTRGRNGSSRTTYESSSAVEFNLEDESGRALVDGRAAEMALEAEFLVDWRIEDHLLARWEELKEKHAPTDGYRHGYLSIQEGILLPDELLGVVGVVRRGPNPSRRKGAESLEVTGTDKHPLWLTNDGKACFSDPDKS